jgi:hypothetical protein
VPPKVIGIPARPSAFSARPKPISFIMAFYRLNRELLGSIGPHGLVRRVHHRPEYIWRVWTHNVVHKGG